MFWFFCCKFCSYVMWLCSQICDQTETQIGPFRFSDSCNLVCHPRAEKQGVAAAVGGTEPPDFCPLILPKLSLLWIDARKGRNNSLDCSRRTDNMTAQSRSMENVQCSCLSVWKGGKATVEPLPVTDQRSDFSLCPVSEGQAHKHTLTHTHTQSDEQGMQRLESLPVRAFCLSLSELRCAMFVYLCACERVRDRKTAGDGEQWPATCRRSQDTSIRRTGAYTPSPPSNPRCPRTAKACFVSLPPALCPVTLL